MSSFYSNLLASATFEPFPSDRDSAWLGHLQFADFVIREHRPAVLVELGSHWGHSYFAFCKSIKNAGIDCKAYAVDTWQGDDHAGLYGEEVFNSVRAHNDGNFSAFSSLLRMTFDEATDYFTDGSVDLLHIDGLHTYEAVKHDFNTWLPKLSPGALVLLHDINVRGRDFGVWKFWEELCEEYPDNIDFHHSYGLGVLQLPRASEKASYEWLRDGVDKEQLRSFFASLGAREQQGLQLRHTQMAVAGLNQEVEQGHSEIERYRRELANMSQQVDGLTGLLEAQSQKLDFLVSTRSWQITRPLRFFFRTIRSIRDALWKRSGVSVWQQARPALSGMTLARIRALYKREGVKGFLIRLRAVIYRFRQDLKGSGLRAKATPPGRNEYYSSVFDIDFTGIDVVSFDVFDTALVRLTCEPTDVFEHVAKVLGIPDFRQKRIEAEKIARSKRPEQRDITLDDIYAELDGIDPASELSLEQRLCRANPEAYLVYCMALNAGKEIYFVSDIYLPKTAVADLLDRNGYVKRTGLQVSSDDFLIKGDGSRYEHLQKGVFSGKKILHIGDNRIADYDQAKRFGLSAFHYAPSDDFFRLDPFIGSQIDHLVSRKSPGVSLMLGLYRYWMLGFRDCEPSFWRKVGFLYGGALIYRFVEFVHESAINNEEETSLYFLARDGDILKKIYELVYGDEALPSHYVWASRRCMSFPVLKDLPDHVDDDVLFLYSMVEGDMTTEDVMERFGRYELQGLQKSLHDREKKYGKLRTELVRSAILENEHELRGVADNEYHDLLSYLSGLDYFTGHSVLVDVGWGGTIQDCLTALFGSNQDGCPQSGIYLGVRPGVRNAESKKGFVYDGDPGQCARFNDFIELIELLTSSPEEGIVRVCKSLEGRFEPERWETREEEDARKSISSEIQKGITDFARLASSSEREGVDLSVIGPNDFLTFFDSLRTSASENVVSEFSKLSHSRMISGPHTIPVLNFDIG